MWTTLCRNIVQTKKPQSRYWTKLEHELFLEALEKFGPKDVKSISTHVGTRTPTQVRTHAQKYFLRLKKGTNDHSDINEPLYNSPKTTNDPPSDTVTINTDNISSHSPSIITSNNLLNITPNVTFGSIRTNNGKINPSNSTSISSAIHSNNISYKNISHPDIVNNSNVYSISQVISPVMKNNSLAFIVKQLIPANSSEELNYQSHTQQRFTIQDKSKLGYAMKVYKHIKDYYTKLNCIQRHFFPKISTEELHLNLTQFISENPKDTCIGNQIELPSTLCDQSKDINEKTDLCDCNKEDKFLDITEEIYTDPLNIFLPEHKNILEEIDVDLEEHFFPLTLDSPSKKPKLK